MKLSPIVPFEPIRTEAFPTGDQWISQVKWDGVRILVYYDGTKVSLINRKLNNRTLQYPELSTIRDYCSAKSVILDGEVIALENGKPSFQEICITKYQWLLFTFPSATQLYKLHPLINGYNYYM